MQFHEFFFMHSPMTQVTAASTHYTQGKNAPGLLTTTQPCSQALNRVGTGTRLPRVTVLYPDHFIHNLCKQGLATFVRISCMIFRNTTEPIFQ